MFTSTQSNRLVSQRAEWVKALDDLPPREGGGNVKIPAFFFGHGSPRLLSDSDKRSPLAAFLKDFGPQLLQKYRPKAIVIFSAHWETEEETLVTDYGESNPLLYDYYGFQKEMYDVKFESRGDSAVSQRVVEALKQAGIPARTTKKEEPRGKDGRGFMGPGLDHGVFVPFKVMFGDKVDVPVIEVSQDGSLSPQKNWALGKALEALRSEGILILSGGLVVHTFRDNSAWSEDTANARIKAFHNAIIEAARSTPDTLQSALYGLTKHPGFREANPREEHFTPIYIAAGAGEDGAAHVVTSQYGAPTIAFGV